MRGISRTSPSRRQSVIPAPIRHPRTQLSFPRPTVIPAQAGIQTPVYRCKQQPANHSNTTPPATQFLSQERAGVGVKTAPPAPYNPKMGDFGRKWEKNRKLLTLGTIRHPPTQPSSVNTTVIPAPHRHSRVGGNPDPRPSSIGPPDSERRLVCARLAKPGRPA